MRRLKVLDTAREERFDRLTREAAEAAGSPIAYFALIDSDRQWLKSSVGDISEEVAREESFCSVTIEQPDGLVVSDAASDPRFRDLEMVRAERGIRAYAGMPVRDASGKAVGTVCVADRRSRDFGTQDLRALSDIAGRVQEELNALPMVFVSYAHEDEEWKDRFLGHCSILRRQGLLDVWEDRAIGTGAEWRVKIRDAIERAKAAVLLISADFLGSDFIHEEEVPRILQRRDREGLRIFPVLVKPCCWDCVPWLEEMNIWPRDARPLAAGEGTQVDHDLSALAGELAATVERLGRPVEIAPPEPAAAPPEAPVEDPPVAAPPPTPAEARPRGPAPLPAGIAIGERLGPYEILERLSGHVFRARDSRIGHEVAIRQLPAHLVGDAVRLERFKAATRELAALNHPNIATVVGLEEHRGCLGLVLELVQGSSLDRRLAAGPLAPAAAVDLAAGVAEALIAAHQRGILHRDLKPSNVMRTPEERVKVLNFGIRRALDVPGSSSIAPTGVLMLVAPYISPEQLRDGEADPRSDIWGLGCILFEALSGKKVFRYTKPAELLMAILTGEADWQALPSSTPPWLEALLRRCLAKDRGERWASAEDLLAALDEMRRRTG